MYLIWTQLRCIYVARLMPFVCGKFFFRFENIFGRLETLPKNFFRSKCRMIIISDRLPFIVCERSVTSGNLTAKLYRVQKKTVSRHVGTRKQIVNLMTLMRGRVMRQMRHILTNISPTMHI